MELAVQIVQIVFYCVAILFMIIFSIILIWGFVIFNKIHRSQKVNNLLLDKINNSISKLHYLNIPSNLEVDKKTTSSTDDNVDLNDLIDDDYTYDKETNSNYSKDNIISF